MASQKTNPKRTGIILGIVAAAAIGAAAFAGAGGGLRLPGQGASLPLTRISTAPIFAPPPGAPLSFADIFERVSPAVVSIDVTTTVANRPVTIPGLPPGFRLPPGFGSPDEEGGGSQREAQASGSGFFISADGYVVTNNHVVENATEITIILKDKRELKATVVGRDEETDLAVVKVEGRNFPFVSFENAATPRVGDWVITIGNPFGLGGTATAGIVSAYGRNLADASSSFVDYLQIDAPINRGNSGGPTFDVYGRVIGVNSAIFSPSAGGGSVGIGFAIPANIADSVTKQLIAGRKVTRGFLGATVTPFSKEAAESFGLPSRDDGGAYVLQVTPGGPADKAGLQAGDVVTSLNGKPVADSTVLTRLVAASRSGDTLRLEVLREGKMRNVNVTSGVRPSMQELAANGEDDDAEAVPNSEDRASRPTTLGLTLAPIDDVARRRFSIPATVRGVVVEAVDPASKTARQLNRGDVIVLARGMPVNTPADVLSAVEAQRSANRPSILFQIIRAGRPGLVIVDLTTSAPAAPVTPAP